MIQRLLATFTLLSLTTAQALAFTPSLYQTADGCEHSFIDIVDHWAEEEICFLFENDIIHGYTDRNFLPNDTINRAELLKISLENVGYVAHANQRYDFADIEPGDWYYRYATFARSQDFIQGYDDNTFQAGEDITRAEALDVMIRTAEILQADTNNIRGIYKDVNQNDWYAEAVSVATEYDLIQGYGDGSFRPNNPISRAEVAVLAAGIWEVLYD